MRCLRSVKTCSFRAGALAGFLLFFTATAVGDHPVDVQLLTSNNEYYKALLSFEKIPRRQNTTESTIAAAKSAWALSLPGRAQELFDEALKDEALDPTERARIYLSKGIVEFQEDRFQVAGLYAERAISLLTAPSPLRARAWILSGQSLARMKEYGAAEEKLLSALDEASNDDKAEVHFHLGEVRMRLNKLEDARVDFENIPLGNERTPLAVRRLGEIALESGTMNKVAFWLEKGRAEYPDSFLDSWVDYALMQAAVGDNNIEEVRNVRQTANQKYPPSDYWLTLLNAAAETYEWKHANEVEVPNADR